MNQSPPSPLANPPWWRGAVIYQIYPRSFQDSDGDGVGDLAGITRRLDYVAALGVDAIWICPFFPSPMRDFGYDVSDYCDIDPLFGTLQDFGELLSRAHALGLKVLIDQVYSHSSSDHPWFAESRAARQNPRAEWYVWADAKADGTPPNNWQSVFGGPAWTWDARRGQYYLHNFLASQPQLNLHHPEVQDALLGIARFWLDRGVDGFRIDALNFAMFDPLLRDNPPAPPPLPGAKRFTRPFDFQKQVHNQFHPATIGFVERLRALAEEYPNIFTLGEIGGDEDHTELKRFTHGQHRLNSAYGFDFLYADALTPALVSEIMSRWDDSPGSGWPSWAFENHDAPRALSRWCPGPGQAAFARLKLALLIALRGNAILYQGEELGLLQDDIPFEQLRDPEALANWPLTLSRDGVRTPMPWDASATGGFTQGTPWLPLSEQNRARAVATQEADAASLLALTRQLLALRKQHPALTLGAMRNVAIADGLLSFDRVAEQATLRCHFNLSAEPRACPAPPAGAEVILSLNDASAATLPPHAALVLHLK